jgi:peptidoglycan/LPS O-acetylase OafA/YrhL
MMTGGYSILAALYVVFLLLALRDGPIQKLCRMSWLRQMGIWAYGLYLMHLIIPDFLLRTAGAHPQMLDGYDWSIFALSVLVVFMAAGLSWNYFEAPLIAWGHRTKGKATAKGPMLRSISPT